MRESPPAGYFTPGDHVLLLTGLGEVVVPRRRGMGIKRRYVVLRTVRRLRLRDLQALPSGTRFPSPVMGCDAPVHPVAQDARSAMTHATSATRASESSAHQVIQIAVCRRRAHRFGAVDRSNALATANASRIVFARNGGGRVVRSCSTSHVTTGVAELVNAALVAGRLLAAARTDGFASDSTYPIGGSELPLPLASRGGGARACAGGEKNSCRADTRSGY
jgi:hypothetical protein